MINGENIGNVYIKIIGNDFRIMSNIKLFQYEMEGLTMGIDIGTSSVKICLLDNQNNKVVSEKSKETQSKIYAGPNVMDSCQQTVFYIIAALNACLSKFGGAVLQKVIF